MNHPTIELRAKQSLTLTPRMQQSVRLLQLSALEFTQEVNDALANNPFLEADDGTPAEGGGNNTDDGSTSATDANVADVSSLEQLAMAGAASDAGNEVSRVDADELAFMATTSFTQEAADGDTYLDYAPGEDHATVPDSASLSDYAETTSSSADDTGLLTPLEDYAHDDASASHQESQREASTEDYAPRGVSGESFDPGDWMHTTASLRDKLHQGLRLTPLAPRDRLAAAIVIESLEDDGYLRQPADEMSALGDVSPPLTMDEIENAVRLVQTLDQPGIAARSLSECLTLQLAAQPPSSQRDLAIELVTHHLERLARRENAELQKRLGCSGDALRSVVALIRRLDPKPGESQTVDEHHYLIPDVIVKQVKGRWAVSINPAVMPRARVHRMYADMFAQSEGSSRSPLAQQLQEARWLLRNVEQRFATILRVATTIVAHQRAFFDYGEIALRPLVLRDVADELHLHESTVSRATGNKYMATPRGIFEFKHFFPRELGTDSGGTCSAAAVRAMLKEMISGESGDAPLSDVTLAKLLADQGVIVARRTVAKYRRLMKVPPAEMRRSAT